MLVLTTGLSMMIKSVYLSLISAILTKTESALHASKDMILKKENVFSLFPTTPSQLISDVELGIGTTRNV